jgi:NADPH-dependent glutamate synthase beta subunit-like oxidoreductase
MQTRRRFLRDTGLATALAAETLTAPARARRTARTVAVFGGGPSGLTVAHELAEQGFEVTVYERRAWGGRARSMGVPGTAAGGRLRR